MTNAVLRGMNDGTFGFWKITNGSIEVILRVREDMGNTAQAALTRARQKNLLGTGVFPSRCNIWSKLATEEEIGKWMEAHPDYQFVENAPKVGKEQKPPKSYVPKPIPFFRV